MNVIVAINAYQEEQMLPGCLENIRAVLPAAKILLIDGAYKSWIAQVKIGYAKHLEYNKQAIAQSMERFLSPNSTDATLDIARQHKVDWIIETPSYIDGATGERKYLPWASEAKKRDMFFQVGQTNDWIFWLDADERLEGGLDKSKLTGDAWCVMLERDDDINPYKVLRLFRQQDGIQIYGAHHAVWIGDDLIKRDPTPLMDGIKIRHLWCERNKHDRVRPIAKGYYYRHLAGKEEAVFRARHGI